ncbi:MAG: epoxyqueuosine reductase QueH [Clostridiales bacterium]|nr:epoxyqueuosine reductase QueH [Clostridiales bacterium]
MNKVNYQKKIDLIIEENLNKGRLPSLFLHACCAPCSSYCLEYLSRFFDITVFYYNPNIFPEEEYEKRAGEIKRFINEFPAENKIKLILGDYKPKVFFEAAKGFETVPEGGERCFRCFRLRLSKAAEKAAKLGYEYLTTTLTISPLKNAEKLNEIGEECAENYGIKWLPSDFKKKNGYKRSIELSREYNLYRQNFCGCVYSKRESEQRT